MFCEKRRACPCAWKAQTCYRRRGSSNSRHGTGHQEDISQGRESRDSRHGPGHEGQESQRIVRPCPISQARCPPTCPVRFRQLSPYLRPRAHQPHQAGTVAQFPQGAIQDHSKLARVYWVQLGPLGIHVRVSCLRPDPSNCCQTVMNRTMVKMSTSFGWVGGWTDGPNPINTN